MPVDTYGRHQGSLCWPAFDRARNGHGGNKQDQFAVQEERPAHNFCGSLAKNLLSTVPKDGPVRAGSPFCSSIVSAEPFMFLSVLGPVLERVVRSCPCESPRGSFGCQNTTQGLAAGSKTAKAAASCQSFHDAHSRSLNTCAFFVCC